MRFLWLTVLAIIFALPVRADGPARWTLSDDDTTITILGSVHVLKPGTVWVDDELQDLITGADKIFLELSPAQQQPQILQPLVQKYGLLPPGETLKTVLPADLYADTIAAFAEVGVPEAAIQQFRPWFAGVNYAVLKFAGLGFNPASGVEATIIGLASARGVDMGGLETAEEQLSIFGAMSREEEINFLKSGLDDRDELQAVMTRLTEGWTTGNTDDLAAYFGEAFDAYPELEENILFARNRNWIDDIAGLLETPGDYLVVVGVGHLIGSQSVIDLLGDAGYSPVRADR